jgi:hypothetical protein
MYATRTTADAAIAGRTYAARLAGPAAGHCRSAGQTAREALQRALNRLDVLLELRELKKDVRHLLDDPPGGCEQSIICNGGKGCGRWYCPAKTDRRQHLC